MHEQPVTTRRSFTLVLEPAPDALRRVITACARRRLEIAALAFTRHGPDAAALQLTLEGRAQALAGAPHWLGALVDVRTLAEAGPWAAAA